ncbi:DUF2750 domain-containing protein [Streptomyces sp. NPDC001492]
MSQSGSQAAAFFRDVRQNQVVWFVRDDDGSPTSRSVDGTRSLPFWSPSARAQRAAKIWGQGLRVESMSLDTWWGTCLAWGRDCSNGGPYGRSM